MVANGYIYKSVTSQLAELDEMDVPEKEWNINDEAFLTTGEVIDRMWESGVPSMIKLGDDLQMIVEREKAFDEDEDEV